MQMSSPSENRSVNWGNVLGFPGWAKPHLESVVSDQE